VTCFHFTGGIVCVPAAAERLHVSPGRNVWLVYSEITGPTFYADRAMCRQIDDWWEDLKIVEAFEAWLDRRRPRPLGRLAWLRRIAQLDENASLEGETEGTTP
jgi:hypothetical protein